MFSILFEEDIVIGDDVLVRRKNREKVQKRIIVDIITPGKNNHTKNKRYILSGGKSSETLKTTCTYEKSTRWRFFKRSGFYGFTKLCT